MYKHACFCCIYICSRFNVNTMLWQYIVTIVMTIKHILNWACVCVCVCVCVCERERERRMRASVRAHVWGMSYTHTDPHTLSLTLTHTHTHTHTLVRFCEKWGHPIGVMVFILYKLYVLLPYTYPTPKLSPHRRLCISTFPKKTSLCMIYKRFEKWGHGSMSWKVTFTL